METESEYKIKDLELEKKKELSLLEAELTLKINGVIIERDAIKLKYDTILPIKNEQIGFLQNQLKETESSNGIWYFIGGTLIGATIILLGAIAINQVSTK